METANHLHQAHIFCTICQDVIHSEVQSAEEIECPTCFTKVKKSQNKWGAFEALMFSLTALVLFIPANMMPFMSFIMYGQKTEATIWSGVLSLYRNGTWFIAAIVFLASIVVPFLKLMILFFIMIPSKNVNTLRQQTNLYHWLEKIGPWSMLDIFVVAVFVAVIKLGSMGTVVAEPGSLLFLIVIILTLISSQIFQPFMIWRNYEKNKHV
jgi:paraquat-inducible protein A